MIAGLEARANRRRKEMEGTGVGTDLDQLLREIEERDRLDSTRTESPLRKADDALVVDTSDLSIEEQVEFVVGKVEEKLKSQKRS
jgi:cytidylate kinase